MLPSCLWAGHRGKGGPLTLEDIQSVSPVAGGILGAGIELGYQVNDPNGLEQIGEC